MITFASTRDHAQNKNLDICSRAFEATNVEKVLVDDAADDWDPAWSENGNQIVFVSERNGDARLFTMKPNGNDQTPLKLGSGIFDDPTFSPDGEHLAFTRRDNEDAAKQLFIADADGSDMRGRQVRRRRERPDLVAGFEAHRADPRRQRLDDRDRRRRDRRGDRRVRRRGRDQHAA